VPSTLCIRARQGDFDISTALAVKTEGTRDAPPRVK
jgi:hypothetical protein